MAYSRWFHSKWYTFAGNDSKNPSNTNFCIQTHEFNEIQFSVNDLINAKENCLFKVKDITKCTDQELTELGTYIDAFLMDIENENID